MVAYGNADGGDTWVVQDRRRWVAGGVVVMGDGGR